MRAPAARLLVAIAVLTVPAGAAAQPRPVRIGIEDAMRRAVGASNPLAAAHAYAEAADADVTAARAGYLPQITASGSYLRTLASEFRGLFDLSAPAEVAVEEGPQLPFGPEHTWRGGIDVTQSIWDGGRTSANVAIARTARDVADLDVRTRRAQAILDATVAYYDAVLAENAVAIGAASLQLAERTLEITRSGFDQGTSAEFDVLRAEVTRDTQRNALVRIRADRQLALLRLRQRLGLPLDRPIELAPPHTDDATPPGYAASLAGVSTLLTRAPVARARAAIDTFDAQAALAQAARLPRITAFSQMGIVDYPRGFAPDGDWRRNWTVGVTLVWTLFDGENAKSQVASARASRRAATAELLEVSELAALDERRTLTDIDVAAAAVASNRRSAELALRAADIASVRYAQGVSTYVELTDARIALDRARIDLASAERDLHVARVRAALLPLLPVDAVGGAAAMAATTTTTTTTTGRTTTTTTGVPTQGSRANLPESFAPGGTLPGTSSGVSGFP